MGKPKGKNPKIKKLAKKKGVSIAGSAPEYTVEQLLERASTALDEYELELAQKFITRAMEKEPDHPGALKMAANMLLEAGDCESAKQCLGRAITVEPDSGHDKFFSMAQLMEGQEALSLYQQGITILANQIHSEPDGASGGASPSPSSSSVDPRRSLSNAFCSVAELFMTDLCDEDDAEAQCTAAIQKAIEADEKNPEAFQTKARLHKIKLEIADAKESMSQSLSLWLPRYTALLENKDEVPDFDPVEVCPMLYTTRIETAKMLMDLEMFDEATQILEGLLEEDDEVVDTWYLLGWLSRLRADADEDTGYNGNARYYLNKAKAVYVKRPSGDEEMMKHVDEILEELGPDEENDSEDEDDKNWEDADSSDEEENGANDMEQA